MAVPAIKFQMARFRKDLVNVEMWLEYDEEEGHVWNVSIEFNGIAHQSTWTYDEPKKAIAAYNRLRAYLLNIKTEL